MNKYTLNLKSARKVQEKDSYRFRYVEEDNLITHIVSDDPNKAIDIAVNSYKKDHTAHINKLETTIIQIEENVEAPETTSPLWYTNIDMDESNNKLVG